MNACDCGNDKIVVTVPLKVGKFEKKCKKLKRVRKTNTTT